MTRASSRPPLLGARRVGARPALAAWTLAVLAAGVGGLSLLAPAAAEAVPGASAPTGSSEAWSDEALRLAETLPVQDDGRIKPLNTLAGYTLLGLNHRRTVRDATGPSQTPIEWLLDVLFRPEVARKTVVFRIEDDAVLDAVGLDPDRTGARKGKGKSDRYAYEDLAPARERLEELGKQYGKIDGKERELVQAGVVDLYHAVLKFESLVGTFDFARTRLPIEGEALKRLFPGRDSVTAVEAAQMGGELELLAGRSDPHGASHGEEDPATNGDVGAAKLRLAAIALAEQAASLSLVPPPGPKDEDPEWVTPGHLLYARLTGHELPPDQATMLDALAALPAASVSMDRFVPTLRTFHAAAEGLARSRGEYEKIGLEVSLTKLDPFYRPLWFYGLAFILLAVTWLKPMRWLTWGAWGAMLVGIGIHVTGIVMRCVVMDRAPISSLYETTLFVAAVIPMLLLAAEAFTRRGVALAIAPVAGALGLFLANRSEVTVLNGEDTMRPLQAVLNTNFWLAVHVTCITLGYIGGLLASLIAHVTVLGRAFGLGKGKPDFYRTVTRMTYGMLGFGLVFSVAGTILGGIWANESWGRFWGWDPKENGALLICLAQIAILHARLGGYIKPFGLAQMTIVQGGVVALSWWGVNLLGIGLHSYGFTTAVAGGLMWFGIVEGAVLAAGFTAWLMGRTSPKPAAAGPTS